MAKLSRAREGNMKNNQNIFDQIRECRVSLFLLEKSRALMNQIPQDRTDDDNSKAAEISRDIRLHVGNIRQDVASLMVAASHPEIRLGLHRIAPFSGHCDSFYVGSKINDGTISRAKLFLLEL